MKHHSNTGGWSRMRLAMAMAALVLVGLTAEAAEDIYLRAVNGSWGAMATPSYKMNLVKDEDDHQVYNWTGFFPESFVIADSNYEICLGSPSAFYITGPSMKPAPMPVTLEPCEYGDDTLMLTTSGKTDRNAEDMLIVERRGNFWQAMIVNPAYFICVDENTDEVFQTDMYGSFENQTLLYECVCDIIGPFKVLRGNGGTAYNRTTPSLFVELDQVYSIDNLASNSKSMIYPDSDEGFKNALVRIRYDLTDYKSTLLITEYIETPTTVLTPQVTEGKEIWYTLQGERLDGPRPGLLIRISEEGASKVLVR